MTLQLDRSKTHSECRGDRTPEDPIYRVTHWQGGPLGKDIARELTAKGIKSLATDIVLLPFDADGELVEDDGRKGDGKKGEWKGIDAENKPTVFYPLWTDTMRAYLERRVKRAAAIAADPEEGIVEQTEDIASASDDVNLVAWLKGQARYEWPLVQAAARKRYSRVFTSKKQMVEDLVVDEKLVREDELSPELAKYLPTAQAA